MKQEELLAARYGKKIRNKQRDRMAILAFGCLALVIFLAWAISVTSSNSSKPTGNLMSYAVDNDHQISAEVSVENRGSKDVTCQVEALANDYEVVGYKEITISKDQNQLKAILSTVKPAVSAVVKDCWFK